MTTRKSRDIDLGFVAEALPSFIQEATEQVEQIERHRPAWSKLLKKFVLDSQTQCVCVEHSSELSVSQRCTQIVADDDEISQVALAQEAVVVCFRPQFAEQRLRAHRQRGNACVHCSDVFAMTPQPG